MPAHWVRGETLSSEFIFFLKFSSLPIFFHSFSFFSISRSLCVTRDSYRAVKPRYYVHNRAVRPKVIRKDNILNHVTNNYARKYIANVEKIESDAGCSTRSSCNNYQADIVTPRGPE